MPRAAKRPDLGAAAVPLEPTYSPAEVAAHFGVTQAEVYRLIRKGKAKPYRGGLAGTFKPTHKRRRIPISSIERHKRWMAGEREEGAAA